MQKRILSIILVLALCFAYIPAVPKVYAADITTIDITGTLQDFFGGPYAYGTTFTFDLEAENPTAPYTISEQILDNNTNDVVYDSSVDGATWTVKSSTGYYRYQIVATRKDAGDSFIWPITPTINGTPNATYEMTGAADAVNGGGISFYSTTYDTPISVTITGRTETVPYNGTTQSVEGFIITAMTPADAPLSDNGFTYNEILYSGTAVASGTDAGTYPMNLNTGTFSLSNTTDITSALNVTVVDGSLTITQAPAPELTANNPTIGLGSTINEGYLYNLTGLAETDDATPTVTWVTPLDVNTPGDYNYQVSAVYVGGIDGNYTGPIANANGTLTVSPYPAATYTQNPVPLYPTYNGQPQELVAAATDQGEVQYSRDSGTTWSAEVPKETNVGNYPLSIKIAGTPGEYFDSDVFGLGTEIIPAPEVTINTVNTTMYVGDTLPVSKLYTVEGTLYGNDETLLTIAPLWVDAENPDTGNIVVGQTYEYLLYVDATAISDNYSDIINSTTHGSVTVLSRPSGGPSDKNTSYDFTQPSDGPGSGKIDDTFWKWGDRANLPKDLATLYMLLSNNSVSENEDNPLPYPSLGTEHFLASDETWELPEENPDIKDTPVQQVLVCQDNEPIYTANGDGKVDQDTFGNSDFYEVGVGTGDMKVDYPNLKTGDVVTNKTFNGVFVTKVQKSNNPTFDADLAKLKSDTIASFRAFELDHPEVFWLNGSIKLRVLTVTISGEQTSFIFMTLVDDGGFTMRIADYAEKGAIEKGIAQRDAAVAAIIAQVPANGSAREKVTNLNKWFTLNNEYNRSADLSAIGYTPHRSLKSLMGNFGINGPVCDGYSRGFKTVCDRLGIPVVLETGTASIGTHSELHMWMSIKIDGIWYGTDTTWNDPIVKGKDGKVSGYENEKYLLVGNDTVVDGAKFGVSHPANKTPGGTTGVLFASIILSADEINGYTAIDYDDVKSTDWFFDYVQDVSARGLMNGTSTNLFSPQGTATRGQIVQILYNIAGQPEVEDVKVEGWFGVPATWAMDKGIVAGYPDGDFHGNDPVTREQLATILWAFEGAPEQSGELSFADADKVSSYAVNAMLWAKKEGLIGGKPGNLADPQGTATRAEIATIFSNYMK